MGKVTKLKQAQAAAYEENIMSSLTKHNKSFKKPVRKKGCAWHEALPQWAIGLCPGKYIRRPEKFVAKSFNQERNRRDSLKWCFELYKIPHALFEFMLHPSSNRIGERNVGKYFEWGIAFGAGKSFYKTFGKDMGLTKAECHWFGIHPEKLSVERAIRWARVKAKGVVDKAIINAIIDSRHEWGNKEAEWTDFFVKCEIKDVNLVNDISDFLMANRDIDLHGRTLNSVVNLMNEWHVTTALQRQKDIEWEGADIADWVHNVRFGEEKINIEAYQICDTKNLMKEGRQMHHCVGGYVGYCQKGISAIFSMTVSSPIRHERVTIEMRLPGKSLVQIRGPWNKAPSSVAMKCVELWKKNAFKVPKYKKEDLTEAVA